MKTLLSFLLIIVSLSSIAQDIKTTIVNYKENETELEGYLAYDSTSKEKRSAVIVVHEWTGINDYTKKRCEELAKMGYVAFAADIYGKGIRPQAPQDAGKEAGKYKNDRTLMRKRIQAALDQVKKHENVDSENIAAIGYCFGGTVALELARSGANIAGVVSFHGGLGTLNPADAKNIKAKILICHGAVDPHVPKEEVDAFFKEMNDAKVDYQFISYSNAVHSFTNPNAGNDPSKGSAYNEKADKRSWEAMKIFFAEIFQTKTNTMAAEKKVTGIGGIFFKSKDPKKMNEWYGKNLGLVTNEYGSLFEFRSTDNPEEKGYLQWSPFSEKTKYFEPSQKEFMINYRVENIERLVEELKQNGVTVLDAIEVVEYGKFVHIMDPEGNKIELWEPVDTEFTRSYEGKTTH